MTNKKKGCISLSTPVIFGLLAIAIPMLAKENSSLTPIANTLTTLLALLVIAGIFIGIPVAIYFFVKKDTPNTTTK